MVLENKLGITDSAELARAEERLSKKRAVELFDSSTLDNLQAGSADSLIEIHRSLFKDIYDFAGIMRTENISRGAFRFAPAMYLDASIVSVESMSQASFDEIVEKYVEMNIAHPFREGNGRSARIWLDLILKKELDMVVNWSVVEKDDYLLAMERSPIKDREIKHLLQHSLTEEITNRDVYINGIDASYHFEGYRAYKAGEL